MLRMPGRQPSRPSITTLQCLHAGALACTYRASLKGWRKMPVARLQHLEDAAMVRLCCFSEMVSYVLADYVV